MSKAIGSREAQTVVYALGDNIQVVCGCYRGNLVEFRERVTEVYGGTDEIHYNNYMRFIEFAETYIEYLKGGE